MNKMKSHRVGEERVNEEGYLCKIINYRKWDDIDVIIDNKYILTNKFYRSFDKGIIKNPYHPSLFGTGYLGIGKHKTKICNIFTDKFLHWERMIRRCYDPKYLKRQQTYINCEASDYFKCFQNFGEWYEENYYQIEKEKMILDKDILIKGNKLYSEKTCIFVPQRINALFGKCDSNRGEYPIGVTYNKKLKTFVSQIGCIDTNKNKIHIGCFNTPEEAFIAYKKEKEKYIKEVADRYKNKIPQKLYEALYKYEVEISD